MDHRTAHYGLYFIFFGVVAALSSLINTKGLDGESLWFLITGVLGLIVSRKSLNDGKLARPYDVIVGAIFGAVGAIGILKAFKIDLLSGLGGSTTGLITHTSVLGLTLAFFPSLVYAVLGLNSLNHGIKGK